MASVVFICNLALSNIGKQNINALTEASAEAKACNQFYEHTRDLLLQGYPWRFAGKTAALGEIANTKPGAWSHAYTRPTDCLKIRWIRQEYATDASCRYPDTQAEELTHPYDIEGNTLFSHLSPCLLRYTYRLTDPTKFSPLFVDALAWQLAVRLAMPLTRDPSIRADAFKLSQQAQALAAEMDANEVRETSDVASDIVASRGGEQWRNHQGRGP